MGTSHFRTLSYSSELKTNFQDTVDILRMLKKHSRYSNNKETEVELLLYYCYKLKTFTPSIKNNVTLTNIYLKQVENIEKKIIKLHEDLQYDFRERLKEITD